MEILVLNGSPAGEDSITLQTALYLEILFPEHHFSYLHPGRLIRKMEKDFSACESALKKAELILFCYPVYTFLAPSQLHRFIELVKEKNIDVSGKFAAQITTSKHFYDITAHRFIRDNCDDLKLHYLGGLSADMEDLLKKKGQKEAEDFFRYILWQKENGLFEPAFFREEGEDCLMSVTPAGKTAETDSCRVAVVTDLSCAEERRRQLGAMISRFVNVCGMKTDIIDLGEFPFAGGCLGCFNCASDGTCIYKDGFQEMLRERIQTADAIVYAYVIKDHSMGSRFKMYDDRQFCNGHRTVTMGMPQGYLVSGMLDREDNLLTLMRARAQVGGNFLAMIASDEHDPDGEIDRLAAVLKYALNRSYVQPADFYGVGGMKIFRDLIYQMQGLMKEDHRFYKKHGIYDDFPQKKKGMILGMYAVGAMMNNPKLKAKMNGKMTEGMIMPYKAVLKKVRKKAGRKKNSK